MWPLVSRDCSAIESAPLWTKFIFSFFIKNETIPCFSHWIQLQVWIREVFEYEKRLQVLIQI